MFYNIGQVIFQSSISRATWTPTPDWAIFTFSGTFLFFLFMVLLLYKFYIICKITFKTLFVLVILLILFWSTNFCKGFILIRVQLCFVMLGYVRLGWVF